MNKHIKVSDFEIGNDLPFVLIAGPCALENKEHAFMMANALKYIAKNLKINFIYKTSFDKANRTSIDGYRGIDFNEAMSIFDGIRYSIGCPIITDVHESWQCHTVAQHVDILQIPAYLCRQTDLLIAAGETGLPINIKKGQFLSPEDMFNVIKKIESTGNENILLCERGSMFGYNNLIVDYRSIPIMASTGYPVVMDATHSVQKPGGQGESSGGNRDYVPTIAKAGVANSVAAVFMECHQDPDNALSDGPNSMKLTQMNQLLKKLKQIDEIVK